jgi:KDO2-lipid IV(A) lauroyltransferase
MRFHHKFNYTSLILFSSWLRSLSETERNRLGIRIARFGYYLLSLRKKDSLKNIATAFPEKSDSERNMIIKKTYSFFAKSFMQFLSLPKSYRYVDIEVEGQELLDGALEKGHGIILATGHFSKWEIMSAWLGYSGYPCVAVAQRQKNRGADIFFREFREITGMRIIYRKSSLKNMYRILKENKILILGSDQDAKQRGVFVNFFNKPASTPKGVARFHLQTGSDIFFISCYVEQNGKHKLQIQPVVPEGKSTVKSITQAFTTLLEEKVRKFPEQYFWFHRRWKTMPHTAS